MNTYKNLGVSFAHDYHEYEDNAVAQARLTQLWDAGVRRIRVNLPPYTTETQNIPFRNQLRLVCTTALDMGFYVIWGYTKSQQAEIPKISAATWPTYSAAIQATATWAQTLTNGANFELSLGNEEDDKVDTASLTLTQFRDNIMALATTCKGIFTKGKVSYTSTIAYYNNWKTYLNGNLASLDYFAVNIYAAPSIFDIYAKAIKTDWGERGYIAEWNASDEGVNDFANEGKYNRELLRRYNLLKAQNTLAYFFVYRSWGVAEKWAWIKDDNTWRKSWSLFTETRPTVYAIDPKKNPTHNYLINPSFDAGVANWTTENSATLTRATAGGGGALTGAYGVIATTSLSSGRVYIQPVSGMRFQGKRCVLSFYAKAGTSSLMNVEAVVAGQVKVVDYTLTSGWVRYTLEYILTSNGTGGTIYFYPKKVGTNTTGSINISNVQLEFFETNVPASSYPSDYVDGSGIFEGGRWDGTPNASSSTRYTLFARHNITR